MTLLKTPRGLTLTLTDTEVRCCFYSYKRLFSLSDSVKAAICALVETVARSKPELGEGEIIATIKARENEGCKIILCPKKERRSEGFWLKAERAEPLVSASAHLCRRGQPPIESKLYKTEDGFALWLGCGDKKRLSGADEFGTLTPAFSREGLGRPIISTQAAERLCGLYYKDLR